MINIVFGKRLGTINQKKIEKKNVFDSLNQSFKCLTHLTNEYSILRNSIKNQILTVF